MSYLFLILSILFNIASYLIYKFISSKQNDFIWTILFALGLLLGGINVYFFTNAIKTIKLGIAYPIFSGACIALMILLSFVFFHERINMYNIIGSVVVIVGIILLTM